MTRPRLTLMQRFRRAMSRVGLLSTAVRIRRSRAVSPLWELNIRGRHRRAAHQLGRQRHPHVQSRLGFKIYVDPADPRAALLRATEGMPDPDAVQLWSALLESVEPEMVVDVGANYGEFTLHALTASRRSSVIALEPNAQVRRYLERSVAEHPDGRVRILPAAAGAEPGRATLVLDHRSSGLTTVTYGTRGDVVPVVTVDDLEGVLSGARVLLKVDVEGNEVEVLRGATRLLAESPVVAMLEFHNLDAGQRAALADLQGRLGFSLHRWDRTTQRLSLIPVGALPSLELDISRFAKDIVLVSRHAGELEIR